MELADAIVKYVRHELDKGKWVAISTVKLDSAKISYIEHLGGGLICYRHPGLPNDIFVAADKIVQFDVRPADWDK